MFANWNLKGFLLAVSTIGGLGLVGFWSWYWMMGRMDADAEHNRAEERETDKFIRDQFLGMMREASEATKAQARADTELANAIEKMAAEMAGVVRELDDVSDESRGLNRRIDSMLPFVKPPEPEPKPEP